MKICEKIENETSTKARRDMNLSERVYKVSSIFLQKGDLDVTVGKRDAKSLEQGWAN